MTESQIIISLIILIPYLISMFIVSKNIPHKLHDAFTLFFVTSLLLTAMFFITLINYNHLIKETRKPDLELLLLE